MNPKQTENKYSRGKIYKLISSNTDEVYVGSTCENLRKRLGQHVANYKMYKKTGKPNYVTSFKLIELGNYDIIELEKFPCQDKSELHARERWWIENTPNCVNMMIPTRGSKDYYEDNKDLIKEKVKKYYLENKERKKSYNKEYGMKNRDVLTMKRKQYLDENRSAIHQQQKKYREMNREYLLAKSRARYETYYRNNKEKIAKRRKLKRITDFILRAEKELEELNKFIQSFDDIDYFSSL